MRSAETAASRLALIVAVVDEAVDTEAAFNELFATASEHFWLDSSRVEPGLSRFSFLGDASGPLSEILSYRLEDGYVEVTDRDGSRIERGDIFDVLSRRLRERRMADVELPFDFTCGYVGYFGYELKADCGARNRHAADEPDAVWIFADRLVAVDHEARRTYVIALHESAPTRHDAQQWVLRTAEHLTRQSPAAREPAVDEAAKGRPEDHLVRDEARYRADIRECQSQLVRGESYEICLTNKLRLPFDDDDQAYYSRLRRANPAPYAALLRFAGLTIFSSSPERFLRIERDGSVESKPIKGTAPRSVDPVRDAEVAEELATSPKTQAENLMIVDLLRNDLGRVCEVGSVTVPRYMAVESYATVHQLVSTVCGRLRPGIGPVECVRRCFPGGSMTGAPKQRTMEIIDRLETEARGVYSGALGYFGLSGGTDLSIIIRTAVRMGDELSIGAGGAIVLDSDPDEEVEEMLLKAAAPLRAWRAPDPPNGRPQDIPASDVATRLRWDGPAATLDAVEEVGEVAIVDSWLTRDGHSRRLDLHATRFARACHELLEMPADETRRFLEAALQRVPTRGAWFPRVELVIVAGHPRLQLWLRPAPELGESVDVWVSPDADRRVRPDLKGPDLAYLQRLRGEAVAHGADEAIITAPDGRLREGSTTSIMWWEGDTLCSVPESAETLPSVTRAVLLEAAVLSGTELAFAHRRPDELDGLEVWAVNALHGIRPVRRWHGRAISAGPAPRASAWNDKLARLAQPGRAHLATQPPADRRRPGDARGPRYHEEVPQT